MAAVRVCRAGPPSRGPCCSNCDGGRRFESCGRADSRSESTAAAGPHELREGRARHPPSPARSGGLRRDATRMHLGAAVSAGALLSSAGFLQTGAGV